MPPIQSSKVLRAAKGRPLRLPSLFASVEQSLLQLIAAWPSVPETEASLSSAAFTAQRLLVMSEQSLDSLGFAAQVGTNTAELGSLAIPMVVALPTHSLEVSLFNTMPLQCCTLGMPSSCMQHGPYD